MRLAPGMLKVPPGAGGRNAPLCRGQWGRWPSARWVGGGQRVHGMGFCGFENAVFRASDRMPVKSKPVTGTGRLRRTGGVAPASSAVAASADTWLSPAVPRLPRGHGNSRRGRSAASSPLRPPQWARRPPVVHVPLTALTCPLQVRATGHPQTQTYPTDNQVHP